MFHMQRVTILRYTVCSLTDNFSSALSCVDLQIAQRLLQQTEQLKRDIEVSMNHTTDFLYAISFAIQAVSAHSALLHSAALTFVTTLISITQGLQRGAAVPAAVMTTHTALTSEVQTLDVHESPALHSCMHQRLQALAGLLQQQLCSALAVHAKALANSSNSSNSSSSSGSGHAVVTLAEPQLSATKSAFRQLVTLQARQSDTAVTSVWALGKVCL
jgi:hypothetical protein